MAPSPKLTLSGQPDMRCTNYPAGRVYFTKPNWMKSYIGFISIAGRKYGIAIDPAGGAWACRGIPIYGPVFHDTVLAIEHDRRYVVAIRAFLALKEIVNNRCKIKYPDANKAGSYGSVVLGRFEDDN